jgi:hypothetical protein
MPPYILKRLTRCSLEPVCREAIRDLAEAAAVHAVRDMGPRDAELLAVPPPPAGAVG